MFCVFVDEVSERKRGGGGGKEGKGGGWLNTIFQPAMFLFKCVPFSFVCL